MGRRGVDYTGIRFTRLVAIKHVSGGQGKSAWICKCDCGKEVTVATHSLVKCATKSCGCLQAANAAARKISADEKRKRRATAAAAKQKDPVRREQKANAQMRYQVSDKAVLATMRRWANKRKNKLIITEAEYLEFRKKPCHKCDKEIEGLGISFLLLKPRGPISADNMVPTCGICKLIKPKDKFDPIAFTKSVVRRFWKKTPMASIARQRARRSRGQYECGVCKNQFREKETQIDHIDPVVDPKIGYVDLETFVTRLLCDDSNLQIICTECHSKKTALENQIREQTKKVGRRNE